MNKVQENKVAMARAVRAVCQGGTTITAGIAAFPAAFAAFNATLDNIDAQAQRQTVQLRPTIEQRDQSEAAMIDATLAIAGMASTYADQLGLKPLATQVRVTEGDFNRARSAVRVRMAQQVCDVVRPVAAQLANHGVTAAALDDLQAKIDAMSEALPTPRQTTAEKKAATAEIAAQLNELDSILRNQLDPLLRTVRKTNRTFYNEYQAARQIVNVPGTRTQDPATPAIPAAAPAVETSAAQAPAEKRAA